MKQKVLVFGSESMVGSRFIELNRDQFDYITPSMTELNLLDSGQVTEYVKGSKASSVVNFAAFTNVDKAEEEKGNKEGIVYKLNAESVGRLADICKENNAHFTYISTAYVFGGDKDSAPYVEEDVTNPLNWYGETKYLGEKFIKASECRNCIVRIDMPFRSKFDLKQDIVRFFLNQLKDEKEITAINDQFVTPVFIDDFSAALGLLIHKQAEGTYHLVASDSTTPFELVNVIAGVFNLNSSKVKQISFEEYNKTRPAKRAKYYWMDNSKFRKEFGEGILHNVAESLEIFKQQVDEIAKN